MGTKRTGAPSPAGPSPVRVSWASASAARSRYSPEPMDDECGVRTSPTTFSSPPGPVGPTRRAAASSMSGSACFAPKTTS